VTKKRAVLLVAGFVLIVVGATFAFSPFGAPAIYTGIGITAHQTYEYSQELRAERRSRRYHRPRSEGSWGAEDAFPAFEEDPLEGLVDVSVASEPTPASDSTPGWGEAVSDPGARDVPVSDPPDPPTRGIVGGLGQ